MRARACVRAHAWGRVGMQCTHVARALAPAPHAPARRARNGPRGVRLGEPRQGAVRLQPAQQCACVASCARVRTCCTHGRNASSLRSSMLRGVCMRACVCARAACVHACMRARARARARARVRQSRRVAAAGSGARPWAGTARGRATHRASMSFCSQGRKRWPRGPAHGFLAALSSSCGASSPSAAWHGMGRHTRVVCSSLWDSGAPGRLRGRARQPERRSIFWLRTPLAQGPQRLGDLLQGLGHGGAAGCVCARSHADLGSGTYRCGCRASLAPPGGP